MKYRSYNARRDGNEKEIVAALRAAGASVVPVSVSGLSDLIVGYQDQTFLIEIKTKKGKLTDAQVRFRADWQGAPVITARTVDDALKAIGAIN